MFKKNSSGRKTKIRIRKGESDCIARKTSSTDAVDNERDYNIKVKNLENESERMIIRFRTSKFKSRKNFITS